MLVKRMRAVVVALITVAALALPTAAATPGGAGGATLDVIVVLEAAPGAGMATVAANVAAGHGLAAAHTYGNALVGFAAAVPGAKLAELESDPRVAYVQLDRVHRVSQPPFCEDDPDHPACGNDDGDDTEPPPQRVPWGIDRTGAIDNQNAADGIHVYVIDTGIDSDHEDLQANIGNGFAATPCRGRTCTEAWDDDHGHGTHVSGTIGAIDNTLGVIGMAPGVTLHAVKVCARSGFCDESDIIAGIDWVTGEVADRGQAAVANMSLGGSGSKTGTCDSTGFTGTDAEHQAICEATNVGVVFAVAAGNSSADAENFVPAAYDDAVITVSATQCEVSTDGDGNQSCVEGSDDWASFSNWGDNEADWTDNVSAPVAIGAPGVSVLSTWNDGGYNTISGTSMATPHVAGAAALYLYSNTQASAYSAFENTREGLLAVDESTETFNNTSGNPHDEDFLDASGL